LRGRQRGLGNVLFVAVGVVHVLVTPLILVFVVCLVLVEIKELAMGCG
jgi:hypothetical protein